MKRWLVRALLALVGLYVLAGTLAWLVPLESKRTMLTRALTPSDKWKVSVGAIRLNLWTGLSAEVEEIRLYRDRPGSQLEVLSIESARLTWPLRSLFKRERALQVRIDSPRLLVAYAFESDTPPSIPTTHAEATGLVRRQVLESPDWRTLRTVAGGLVAMQLSLSSSLKEIGPEARIDRFEVRNGNVEISFPPLLGGETVAVVAEGLNLVSSAPHPDHPGTLWAGGTLAVGAERRELFATGLIETSHADSPDETEYLLPNLIVQLGEVPMQVRARIGGDLNALAREASAFSGSRSDDDDDDDDSPEPPTGSAALEQQRPPPPQESAEQFGDLSLHIANGVESLGPLWTPLMAPGFEWKLLGGVDLSLSLQRRNGKLRSAFEVDMTQTGLLRAGWFHKPRNIPAKIAVTSARDERSSSVLDVQLALADLRVEMGGLYRDDGDKAATLQFHGRADSLKGLAPLVEGGRLATAEPSGLRLKGEAVLHRRPIPRAEIRLEELSLHAGNSDLHIAGDVAMGEQFATDLSVLSNEMIPGDWLSERGREALGPLAIFLSVPLDSMEMRLITDSTAVSIRGIRARWAEGELQGHGRYLRSSCRGEGQLALIRSRLGAAGESLGAGQVVDGLSEARLSVLGEVGRDLPCTGGSPGPIDAWGANLEVFAENMYLPVLSGMSGADANSLASALGIEFDPIPEIREGRGTLRWQGRRARLESFQLNADPLQVSISGELGEFGDQLELNGELIGPAPKGGLAGSVLGNLFGQGTPLRLPIQIRGTWAAPEILLDSEGLSVRELLKRNAEAAAEARGMPIPQATEE